jgi:uncharacterized protein (TIGR00369 family)
VTWTDAGLEGPVQGQIPEALAKQEVIFRDTFPGWLGVRILEAEPGRAVGTLEVDDRVRHPGGYAHGGALAGFGDSVAAWATFPALAQGEVFTTLEFKTNFLAGVTSGRLRCEATAVHHGRRTMVISVRITTDEPEPSLVAVMMVTQAILRAPGPGAEAPPDG